MMRRIVILTFLLLIFASCKQRGNNEERIGPSESNWMHTEILKDTLDVKIPIEGKLVAWKKVDILSPLKARLIALLVEKGEAVQRGDLLFSLWPINQKNNFTPVNIYSPLAGSVREIYFHLDDTIPNQKPILTVENRDNLVMKASLSKAKMYFVQKNQNVTLHFGNTNIKGAVLDVDKASMQVTVIVPNKKLKINRDLYVYGFIDLGSIAGNFLDKKKFGLSDSVHAKIDDELELTLYCAGTANDSLALIFPTLPDIDTILIKKNLDNRK